MANHTGKKRFSSGRRYIYWGVALCVMASVGTAAAEWSVADRTARTTLSNIKDQIGGSSGETVSGRLVKMHSQQQVRGVADSPTTKRSLNPYSESEYQYKQEFPVRAEDAGVATRCPTRSQNPARDAQNPICTELVTWENRQYNFVIETLRVTKLREDKLDEIYRERNAIQPEELGALQANTNRLLALQAQQQIDAINTKAMMDGYAATIARLKEDVSLEGKKAMGGAASEGAEGGGWDEVAGAFTQSGMLATALIAAREVRER